jgi:hypothetical protein
MYRVRHNRYLLGGTFFLQVVTRYGCTYKRNKTSILLRLSAPQFHFAILPFYILTLQGCSYGNKTMFHEKRCFTSERTQFVPASGGSLHSREIIIYIVRNELTTNSWYACYFITYAIKQSRARQIFSETKQ